MSKVFEAFRISERAYWVGAVDWGMRNFHGYLTERGTSYNAYLVLGSEGAVLLDAVKPGFEDEMLSRIASVIDPGEIRWVISNHAEMDHSGTLPKVIERVQPERVLASPKGVEALAEHFHWDVPVEPVKTGDRIELGDLAFRFFEAKMLHWPDSMFSYLEGDRVLFTNDAFGMHLASTERFCDEVDEKVVRREAAKYFANILLPFAGPVNVLLKKLPDWQLDIAQIAPDHGPNWRRDPLQVVELYRNWAAGAPTRKAVVVYDTMWKSTTRMAEAVAEGLKAGGAQPVMMPLDVNHRSDVATEVLEAGALLVGSPTMNNHLFPSLADLLYYLKGLKPKNLVGAAFGSYGWSGEAVAQINGLLEQMKVELVDEGVRVKYVPDDEALARCRALGEHTAARMAEKLG